MTADPDSTLGRIDAAARLIQTVVVPTPQIRWPLLCQRAGREVWVKHENHTIIGSFKLRGGFVYLHCLMQEQPEQTGVVAASHGNHGQSVALAARHFGLGAAIVVPENNPPERNDAIAALGAEVVVRGRDFQEASEEAQHLALRCGLHYVPAFHPWLVQGVASWALEFLRAVPDLDVLYVPIGMGSAICGAIAARDALGSQTRIVGVVAEGAAAYADSYWAGHVSATGDVRTVADALACRVPDPLAVAIIAQGASRVVTVGDEAIVAAMRHFFTDTHNVAEPAGAAALAALLNDGADQGRAGVLLSGGNVAIGLFRRALGEEDATP